MKIFNWMCPRFNDEKDKSIDNVKQNDNENDNYKQSLINDHDQFDDDQWRGGLLTIGTFGMDPHHKNYPNEYYCPNHYNMVEKYEEVNEIKKSYNDDDDEYVTCIINDFCDDQSEALIKIKKMDGVDDAVIDRLSDYEITAVVEKKERITLADLFKAESAEMEEKHPSKLIQKKKATTTPPGKLPEQQQLLKKKKQMSPTSIKQISQPVQKLLKRMLKRKIHPELEGRTKSCAAGGGVPSTKRELGAHDTITLLQTLYGVNSEVRA